MISGVIFHFLLPSSLSLSLSPLPFPFLSHPIIVTHIHTQTEIQTHARTQPRQIVKYKEIGTQKKKEQIKFEFPKAEPKVLKKKSEMEIFLQTSGR